MPLANSRSVESSFLVDCWSAPFAVAGGGAADRAVFMARTLVVAATCDCGHSGFMDLP